MDYEERLAQVENPSLQKKVRYALMVEAYNILQNQQSSQPQRDWAVGVMSSKLAQSQIMMGVMFCMANPAIGDLGVKADDSDIQFVVHQNLGLIQGG